MSLDRYDFTVRYQEVKFQDPEETLTLPRRVEVTSVMAWRWDTPQPDYSGVFRLPPVRNRRADRACRRSPIALIGLQTHLVTRLPSA